MNNFFDFFKELIKVALIIVFIWGMTSLGSTSKAKFLIFMGTSILIIIIWSFLNPEN